ncbi:MAG: hypothetical protein N3A38_03400 [Planctomycetota bacterium]|nr:hypothetical protein [Planctomycetota bacterium]
MRRRGAGKIQDTVKAQGGNLAMAGGEKKGGKSGTSVGTGWDGGPRRLLTIAACLLPPAIAVAAYAWGVARLWEYAGSRREYAVAGTGWSDARTGAAAWLPRRDASALDEIAASARGRCAFEPGLGEGIARKFAANPWVESVEEVRCIFGRPSSVRADIRLRVPFAAVAGAAGGGVVADRAGTVLPLPEGEARHPGLPVIRVRARIGEKPGEKLKDRAALDAINALGLLSDRLAMLPAGKSVRVTEVRTEPSEAGTRLSFLTASGAAIEWGEFAAEPAWGEPTTRRKLDLLEKRAREITDWSRIERLRLDHETAPMKLKELAPAGPSITRSSAPATQPDARR